MTSKSRPTSSKLNSFFKFRSSSKETTLHETLRLDSARPTDPIDANEIVQQLLPGVNTLQSRLRTLEELNGIVLSYPFQHISELWVAVEDLLGAGVPHNARKAAWNFMVACIQGQFEDLGMLRAVFYQAINNHEIWEDFDDKLQALKELTNNGRDVYGFEKNIVRLLAHWIAASFDRAKVAQHISQQKSGMQKSTTSLVSLSSTPHLILLQKPIPHFDTTMALLINVVKFNFVFFDEVEIANILDLLHTICINGPEDTVHAIGFLDVIVRYGYVPAEGLAQFLKILCLTTLSDTYREQAWAITVNLMKSHSAHSAIRLLCLNLRSKNEVINSLAHVRVIQGSIRLLERSVWGSNPIDTLSVSFSTVLWSLKSAVDFRARDVDQDIIKSLGVLLNAHYEQLGDLEYEIILDILEGLVGLVTEKTTGEPAAQRPFVFGFGTGATSGHGHGQHTNPLRDSYGHLLNQFIGLYNIKRIPGITARLMSLLASLQDHLPQETVLLLLQYYHSEHQFYPYTPNWLDRLRKLVQVSVIQETRPRIRAQALLIALDVYDSSLDFFHDDIVTTVFMDAIDCLPSETEPELASQLTSLMVKATRIASEDLFPKLLDRLVRTIRCSCHMPKPPLAGTSAAPSLASRFGMSSTNSSQPQSTTHSQGPPIACQSLPATIGIIDLFQHALYDPNGASKVDEFFSLLVALAINQDIHKASRLVLLDFLLCLRVDLDHRIFCSNASTLESMTAATEQLLSEETRQDRGDRSIVGVMSAANRGMVASVAQGQNSTRQTTVSHPSLNWTPLMQGRTVQASPYVISYLEIASTTDDAQPEDALPAPLVGLAKVILNIPLYMTGIITILDQERDFEIYSFVIQRLPSQLFNKHLFCNSSEQITRLHSALIEMTLRDKIPDSLRNLPLSAKRHNIHILVYKVLVILLCYHSKFNTKELNDLVQAFVVGLQRQATCAKICIHALVVCCYELPQAMTRHLPGTVLKLSQIMSTATISVHILEFLSTVARLPMLYANFVENDYKRVFGIALKYIQYTHSVAGSSQPSSSAPSSAVSSPMSPSVTPLAQQSTGVRALPQYVLIMAYQVIDVWFMLQRLPERRKYVPYIVRNLLMANEGGKRLDEQTETCLDMLSRYSYANCEPKPRSSLIQQLLIGPGGKASKVVTKTWIQGNAFVTVRTAHSVGWAEITVRRASGTVSFLLKIENEMFMDAADDFDFTTLPGLLRVQEAANASSTAATVVAPADLGMAGTVDSERGIGMEGSFILDHVELSQPSEEAQHLAAVSGLSQRLGELRPSWLSPRPTPQPSPQVTPLQTPIHTPRQTPHHTPRASPLPSGDNTPSSSPPSRSFMPVGPSKLTYESDRVGGGHQRIQTAPTEHAAVFSSHYVHPLQDSDAPGGAVEDDEGGASKKGAGDGTSVVPASGNSSAASASNAGVLTSLGRSKSASEHSGPSSKTGVKQAELSRGPSGGALEQTKSLLSQSVGNIKREDVRRSISVASSRNNSITSAAGRAHRYALGHDDHRSLGANESNEGNSRAFTKAKMETFVDPSFLLMQLTSFPDALAREAPLLMPEDDTTTRAIGVLDRTPVVDFHKIGVLYVGKGQSKESEILANTHGSSEYTQFLGGLGTLVRLKEAKIYAGGLDLEMDLDGEYAYSHQDEITQMIFHVATMMPNNPHDPQFNGKKRHIGNDWVTIVYNESGNDYDFGTISGQFNFMTVVVTPVSMASVTFTETTSRLSRKASMQPSGTEEEGSTMYQQVPLSVPGTGAGSSLSVQPFKNVWFKVVMLRRPDMPEIGPLATPKIISASELARFTRQMALHANIYAQVYYQHLQNSVEYVSNWQERLRQIKRVKERLTGAGGSGTGSGLHAGNSGAAAGNGGSGVGHVGGGTGSGAGSSRAGGGANASQGGGGGGPNSNLTGAAAGGHGSSIGLGLGLGLGASMGLGQSASSGAAAGGGGGGGTSSSTSQSQGVMGLEPMVDFTRYT